MNTNPNASGAPGAADWRTQGGPTPPDAGPAGNYQQGQPSHGAPHAPITAPSGFFNSARYSGWYRSSNRIIGGVCSGAAEKLGWDPILVRGLVFVIALFFSPLALLYAIAWALLPEQADGRIHLEELTAGHFDVAHLGQILLLIIGLGGTGSYLGLAIGPAGWWIIPLAFLAAVVAVIIAVAAASSRPSPNSRPTPPSGVPMSFTPNGHSVPQGAPVPPRYAPHPGGPAPMGARPVPPMGMQGRPGPMPRPAAPWTVPTPSTRPRLVSGAWSLAVTGFVVLALAVTFFLMRWFYIAAVENPEGLFDLYMVQTMLIGGGICLLIVGAALVVASFKDRAAGWLVGLSIFGMFLAGPTALVSIPMSYDARNPGWETPNVDFSIGGHIEGSWLDDHIDTASVVSRVQLSLEEAPEDLDKTITIGDGIVDHIDVTIRKGQSVSIIADGFINEISYKYPNHGGGVVDAEGEGLHSIGEDDPVWQSDGYRSSEAIVLVISGLVSDVTITEVSVDDSTRLLDEGESGGAQSGIGESAGNQSTGGAALGVAPSVGTAVLVPYRSN